MNERIFDMARQSGATDEKGSRAEHVFCFTKDELKGFTELIVRECIGILNSPDFIMEKKVKLSRYNEGWVNGRLLGSEHIREYFGVEE